MYNNNIFRINSEKCFFYLICLLWGYQAFFRFFDIVLRRIPIIGNMIMPFIIFVLIIGSLSFIAKKIILSDILFTLCVVFVSLVTIMLDLPSTEPFNDLCFTFLSQCLVMYFVGISFYVELRNNREIMSVLKFISILSIFTLTIVYRSTSSGFDYEWNSNQYIPYLLLPHILLVMASAYEKISVVNMLTLVYGVVNIVMLGNRGSTVCMLVMLFFLTYFKTAKMNKKRRLVLLLFIILVITVVWMTNAYETALLGMYKYALDHNMSTRVFQTFLGEFSSGTSLDSGRLEIQKELIRQIKINPFGYGLGGDRVFTGWYAHNIFLELIVQFGIFIGGFLCVFLVYIVISSLRKSRAEMQILSMLLLFMCTGLIKLLISGSYLIEPYFFLLLGFAISIRRDKSLISDKKLLYQ